MKSKKSKIESVSLDISDYWTSNDFLTESNDRCGTLVAFDWRGDYLTEINTNIDLGEMEIRSRRFRQPVNLLRHQT